MLTSAITQHHAQVQPQVEQYTGRSPKTEADYVKLFNAIYEREDDEADVESGHVVAPSEQKRT